MTKGNQNISCSNLWKEVQWVNDADRSDTDQETRALVKSSSVHSFSFFVFLSYFAKPSIFSSGV